MVKNESNKYLVAEPLHNSINYCGPKIMLILNLCLVVYFIAMYYYAPFPVTAIQVYGCMAAIFATNILYRSGFNNRIEIYYIAFAMIVLNEVLFAVLNRSVKYLVTVITCKVVFYVWPLIYAMLMKTYNEKGIKILISISMLLYLITSYTTDIGLDIYPFASRLLAGHATADEKVIFDQMGIGGFAYVYAGVLLVPSVIFCVMKLRNIPLKLVMVLISLYEMYVVIKADYTIAACMVILLLASIYIYRRKPAAIILLGLLILAFGIVMLLYIEPILQKLSQFAFEHDFFTVGYNFNVLEKAIMMNKVTEITRIRLYLTSWYTILKYPVIGGMWFSGAQYGSHSGLLDYVAQFGIFSIWFFVYITSAFSMQIKSLTDEKLKTGLRVVHVFFYLLILTNMYSIYVDIAIAVFLIIPLIFWLTDQELLKRAKADLKSEQCRQIN